MINTIKCKYCGKEIEISEALLHKIEDEALASEKARHQKELMVAKKTAREEAGTEIREEKERNLKLLKQLGDLSGEIRQLRRKDEERELEMKKRLVDEEGKIREETRKKTLEEHELKDKEKDMKLNDALKKVEELKTKMQQGSQQTQGEVLELEVEDLLKKEYPADIIREVKKGQRGADIIQEVIDKRGRNCGTILWESKNAQWSNGWISKLKEDQRQAKAHLAVLVVTNPPENIKTFDYMDGIWVCTRKMIIPLARALRFDSIRLNYEKLANVGKNEKMEVLYQYVTSTEFKQRIEAIVEAFGGLQDEMEREKRWFVTKWAREEKHLRKVIDHTQGMYGDLQGVVGKSLPEIKSLRLEAGEGK